MAEFLIKGVDYVNSDPVKDKIGAYKRGDVVQVYPDGSFTEVISKNSKMVAIKVPGISFEDAKKYMESEFDRDGNILTRRRYKFRLDDMPTATRESLDAKEIVTFTEAGAGSFLRDKPSNEDVSSLGSG